LGKVVSSSIVQRYLDYIWTRVRTLDIYLVIYDKYKELISK